jgi:hypothetical protein
MSIPRSPGVRHSDPDGKVDTVKVVFNLAITVFWVAFVGPWRK